MLTIYKYTIEGSCTEVKANVVQWLDVGWQEREGCFVAWALVNPEGAERSFLIKLIKTGEYVSDTQLEGYRYLGSVNLDFYVSHFFVAEINPENKEVLVDDKNFNVTWSPDHLSWLDPNVLEDFFNEKEFL